MATAEALQVADNIFGNGALIEPVAAFRRDHFQSRRQFRLPVKASGLGGGAIRQVNPFRRRVLDQHGLTQFPIETNSVVDGKPLVGVMDGVLKRICDRTGAVIFKQPAPSIDRAGYGYRVG